jgi:multidrug efflux system outer membrane protein
MRRARPGPVRAVLLLGALPLAGCAVGPRYRPPESALPVTFREAPADRYDLAQAPHGALWAAFTDPALDALLRRALAENRSLAAAAARLREARALRGLDTFALLPVITAGANRQRSQYGNRDPLVPPNLGTVDTYRAGFDASWEIDLFGGARRAREAALAEEDASAADLEAARESVAAEVAQAYFGLRAAEERLDVERRDVANLTESLGFIDARRGAGRGSEVEVEAARATLLGASARVPATEADVARNEQRLAVLTAQSAVAVRDTLGAPRAAPALPALVAVGSPADWLRRRPDIRAAERRLAAATAEVGVAVAEFFPVLSLNGSFGWTSQRGQDIGRQAAQRWQYGPALSWSFLDVGRVRQRVLAARAAAAATLANYDDVVLRALEETENALAGYRATNRSAQLLEEAVGAARRGYQLADARLRAGSTDTLAALEAERVLLDLADQLATAKAQRLTALAALYKALGGDFAALPDGPRAAQLP